MNKNSFAIQDGSCMCSFNLSQKIIAILFGIRLKCKNCNEHWRYSKRWTSIFTILQLIGLFFSMSYSVMYKAYVPYAIWGGFILLCTWFIYRFAPLVRFKL